VVSAREQVGLARALACSQSHHRARPAGAVRESGGWTLESPINLTTANDPAGPYLILLTRRQRARGAARPDTPLLEWYCIWYRSRRLSDMSITASEARKSLFPLIKKVNEDHDAVEIVSRHGNAVLISAEDFSALQEGAYLLRSPANARRLLSAYENALNNAGLAERELIDPDADRPGQT
jgi:antitoxin YefM